MRNRPGIAAIATLFLVLTGIRAAEAAFAQETTTETPAAPTPEVKASSATSETPAPRAEPEAETLVGNGDVTSGGYGGPGVKFARIAGNNEVFVGGRGGWIINNTFVIGGAGYGMATNPKAPNQARTAYAVSNLIEERLSVGYGGLLLEYFIMPKKVVHATAGLLIGGGGVSVNQRLHDRYGNDDSDNNENMMNGPNDSFFILEPEVHCELNIVHFLRADLGASYRVVTGVNGIGLENKDLRGPGASLLLRFGKF